MWKYNPQNMQEKLKIFYALCIFLCIGEVSDNFAFVLPFRWHPCVPRKLEALFARPPQADFLAILDAQPSAHSSRIQAVRMRHVLREWTISDVLAAAETMEAVWFLRGLHTIKFGGPERVALRCVVVRVVVRVRLWSLKCCYCLLLAICALLCFPSHLEPTWQSRLSFRAVVGACISISDGCPLFQLCVAQTMDVLVAEMGFHSPQRKNLVAIGALDFPFRGWAQVMELSGPEAPFFLLCCAALSHRRPFSLTFAAIGSISRILCQRLLYVYIYN